MQNNDAKLIQRVLEGDDNAFSVLVEKYQKQVHALAWRKIGDFHIAEEITQDTFLKAYKRLATLKEPQRFVSWLYVIAANRCSSWLRKKRLWTQPIEELEETENTQHQTSTYSGYIAEENERTTAEAQRDVVQKLLTKLQESERTVITLHYFAEMSCTEISAFLGVSANTIKSRLRRAQQRLKREEPMIRAALENFKIAPNLTENVMQEIARIKPTAPSSGKPFMPWAVAASTAVIVLLMLGIGNQQSAIRFQQPYSLEAASEMTVELIDAPFLLKRAAKPDVRTQIGSTNIQDRSNTPHQQPDNTPAFVTQAHADELVDDYTKWELPKKAKARLGKGRINALQFSPDGTQFAVGSNIGVWLYDLKTGKEIDMFPGRGRAIAFSPDGRYIVSGGSKFGKEGLQLWDLATGQEVALIDDSKFGKEGLQLWDLATGQEVALIDDLSSASALHFSEDGTTLLGLGNWGELISQLNVETREVNVKDIEDRSWEKIPRRRSPEPYALTHDKFAVGGQNGKIQLWHTAGVKLSTLIGHGRREFPAIIEKILGREPASDDNNHVLVLEFSPDGTRLASGSKDKTVRLWDTDTGDELAILRKHTEWTNVLAFSPDGKMLATGSADKTVHLWDTDTGKLLMPLIGHLNSIAALAFSPDGNTLASGSTDGTVRFWNTQTGDLLPLEITEHTQWVAAVSFFKDNATLVSVAFNGVITFWDLQTSQKTAVQRTAHQDFLPTLALSPDGTKFASVGAKANIFFDAGTGIPLFSTWQSKGLVQLIDVTTGHALAAFPEIHAGTGLHSSMTFSPDGKMVAFDSSGKIHLRNTETGTSLDISVLDERNANVNEDLDPLLDVMLMLHQISALVFSPDGKTLVSGTLGGRVQMWDTETGLELARFLAGQNVDETAKAVSYQDSIKTLAFSSDGTLLTVGSDRKIRLFGSHKQNQLKEISHGADSLVFSPDNSVLIAGLRSGTIELWELATGEKLSTLDGHIAPVGTLVFSPDGKTLVSTGQDGTILLWDWEEVLE